MYNEPMKWLISYSKICGKKLTMNQRLRKTLTKIKHKLLQLQDDTMTGCVLCFRARDAPIVVDQYVTKPIKSQVKLTNCVLALRAVNVVDVNVGSLRIRKKSRSLRRVRTSSSAGGHLTQEEAVKVVSQTYLWLKNRCNKVDLDGNIVEEEEEEVKMIKGEALKEKNDPRAFIFPIRLEGQVNENALADTRSDINTMPYWIYEQLGREEMKKIGVTTLIAKFLILDIPIDRDAPIVVGRGFLCTICGILNTPERLFSTFDGFCHQTFHAARSDVMRNAESDIDDEEEYEIKGNKFRASIYGLKPAPYLNCNDSAERWLAIQTITNPFRKISVWKKGR
ncbi:hypothetical protein Tco_0458378 [Tanacetum coccineum]